LALLSAAVTAGGALYTWGQAEAQYPGSHFPGKGLGNDDLALNKLVPTLVPGRLLGGCWVARATGGATSCARNSR